MNIQTATASMLLISTAYLFSSSALAQPDHGAATPPQSLPGAQLQGRATLRFLGLPIYEARLWAASDFELAQYTQHPFVLELQYRRALTGSRIAERSLLEMRRQDGFDAPQAAGWEAQLRALFPDVTEGDRLTAQYQPGKGARFWHNTRERGSLSDLRLVRLFFGIWLSPQTSEPALRCQLAACADKARTAEPVL